MSRPIYVGRVHPKTRTITHVHIETRRKVSGYLLTVCGMPIVRPPRGYWQYVQRFRTDQLCASCVRIAPAPEGKPS